MKIDIPVAPFRLPNFLAINALGKEGRLPVGELSDEDAATYWDWMKDKWMDHVRQKRIELREKP